MISMNSDCMILLLSLLLFLLYIYESDELVNQLMYVLHALFRIDSVSPVCFFIYFFFFLLKYYFNKCNNIPKEKIDAWLPVAIQRTHLHTHTHTAYQNLAREFYSRFSSLFLVVKYIYIILILKIEK